MNIKSQVGQKSGPYREVMTLARIADFGRAIGMTHGTDSWVVGTAPATLMTIFRKGEFDLFQKLQIPLSKVLHAEQEYLYENSIEPEDRISYETVLSQVLEKGGAHKASIQFLVFETRVQAERDSRSVPIGTGKTTIVVR